MIGEERRSRPILKLNPQWRDRRRQMTFKPERDQKPVVAAAMPAGIVKEG